MGEALEMAKANLGLKDKTGMKQTQVEKQEQTLDELLAEMEKEDLTEAKKTKLKLHIAEMKARIRELENRPAGGQQVSEGARGPSREEVLADMRREVAENAVAFLQQNVPPDHVGRYLTNAMSGLSGAMGVPGGTTDIPGMIVAIANAIKPSSNGSDSRVVQLLEKLSDNSERERLQMMKDMADQNRAILEEIKNLVKTNAEKKEAGGSEKPAKSRVTVIKPDFTLMEFDADKPIIVPAPAPGTQGGDSLEVLREKHRHEEEMETRRADNDNKREMRKIMGEIPERIGHGLASRAVSGEEGEAEEEEPQNKGNLQFWKCTNGDCGFNIPIPPGAEAIECPKCKAIYEKKPKAKEKEQAG
jgi:hypothetical protein